MIDSVALSQAGYRILADALLIAHLFFILFVVLGGLLVLRNRRWAYLHLPAVLWGAAVEFKGWVCPLTPLENRLLSAGGRAGYAGEFIEHYLLAVIYPPGLTPHLQTLLGSLAIGINLLIYAVVVRRCLNRNPARDIA
jgi:hypothetical protein